MAKINGALMSNEASGSIAGNLTFSKRASGQQVRWQKKQEIIAPTWAQTDQQSLYRLAYARWLAFTDEQRQAYNDDANAKKVRISGWNLFLKRAISDPLEYLGLAGYWSMNRTGFGTVLDLSKNGNTGTLKPSWPANAPQYIDSKNKKMLNALSFDGSNDYVETAIIGFGKGNFTLGAWVYPTSTTRYQAIIDNADGTNGYRLFAQSFPDDKTFLFIRGFAAADGVPSNEVIQYNQWQHVMVVIESDSVYFFHNSQPAGSGSLKDVTTDTANKTLLAYRPHKPSLVTHYKGALDEVSIYNRALSLPEIQALYNQFKGA
jgi:hypothetical protein